MAKNVLAKSALLQVPHRVLVFDKLQVIHFLIRGTILCREASVPSLLYHLKNSDLNLIQANIDNLKTVGAESTTESVNCFVPSNKYDKSDE